MRLLLMISLILMVGTLPLAAQTAAPAAPSLSPTAHLADPYTDEEFPSWVLKLRRFEIIAVGAFPLAYLFAGLGYDYYYYTANGFPSANIPWPAGPGTSSWTTTNQPDQLQQKNITLVEMSVIMSLAIATADWFLGLYE